jgi:hypothetical protein
MPKAKSSKSAILEARLQRAIDGLKSGQFSTKSAAAAACEVSLSTLKKRVAGRPSRTTARQNQQNLSPTEEETLLRWITRNTRNGTLLTPGMVMGMAKNLYADRVHLSTTSTLPPATFDHNWLERFKNRFPQLQGIWTRQITRDRFDAATQNTARPWFDAVATAFGGDCPLPDDIYNMDETGFAMGGTLSTRAVVDGHQNQRFKVTPDRGEWITSIECVSAAGRVLPPMIIFKGKNVLNAWKPDSAPTDWSFQSSNKGWTNKFLGFKWLTEVFEPETRPDSPNRRRTLILDGHSSHTQSKFAQFCLDHNITLLLLPPHCTHELQPLDIGLFRPVKGSMAAWADQRATLTNGRVQKREWVEEFIRARERSFTPKNVKSAFRTAGLWPFLPQTALRRLRKSTPDTTERPTTPTGDENLDISLLLSSPPDDTTLQNANNAFNTLLEGVEGLHPAAKAYAKRMTLDHEFRCTQSTIARGELKRQQVLLRVKKIRKTGITAVLRGVFHLTDPTVIDDVRGCETVTAARNAKKQPNPPTTMIKIEEQFIMDIENDSEGFDSDCVIVGEENLDL